MRRNEMKKQLDTLPGRVLSYLEWLEGAMNQKEDPLPSWKAADVLEEKGKKLKLLLLQEDFGTSRFSHLERTYGMVLSEVERLRGAFDRDDSPDLPWYAGSRMGRVDPLACAAELCLLPEDREAEFDMPEGWYENTLKELKLLRYDIREAELDFARRFYAWFVKAEDYRQARKSIVRWGEVWGKKTVSGWKTWAKARNAMADVVRSRWPREVANFDPELWGDKPLGFEPKVPGPKAPSWMWKEYIRRWSTEQAETEQDVLTQKGVTVSADDLYNSLIESMEGSEESNGDMDISPEDFYPTTEEESGDYESPKERWSMAERLQRFYSRCPSPIGHSAGVPIDEMWELFGNVKLSRIQARRTPIAEILAWQGRR